jgi:glucose/arabinose dehydrogenase
MKFTATPRSFRHRSFLIGTAALLSTALLPLTASAAPPPLVSNPTGLCLDVKGNDPTPRALVQLWSCNLQRNQQWELTSAGELRAFDGTRCLDVRGASTAPRSIVQSTTCNGGANQKWSFKSDGTIVGVASGLCLTVMGAGRSAGTGIDIWPCEGAPHQKWTLNGGATADTQAPTAPSGLKIANLACRSVNMSWGASSDNVGVAFYDIYHDGQLITSVSGSTLSTSVPLTPGVSWGLYVNGRDAAGNVSQSSATVPVAVPQCVADTQSPTTPTGLKGSATGTSASLNWAASSDNIGVTAYDVFRNDAKVGSTATLSFTDSGLAANTAYRYAVAARDAQNNSSGRSTSVTVTTGASCSTAVCSVKQITTETDIPWGMVALPDGKVLYSRRDAQDIILLDPVTGNKSTVGTVQNVAGTNGEGGLLGLAVTPDFPGNDPWLYVYHTSGSDNRIVRIKYASGRIDNSSLQVLLSGIGKNTFHNGGRLRFGPDGKLYAAVGDAQEPGKNPQDKNNLNGKILRLNPDGSKPADNPFNNYVWSFGHRNPQGLAFDSKGRLWAQEFGDGDEDETNLIERGGNYGYPNCEGTVSKGGSGCGTSGYIAPKAVYKTADGSCSGIAVVRDVLYVACLRGTRVYRHVISGSSLTNTQQLFSGTYGRIRTVQPSIDGNLWMSTSNGGDKDNTPNNSDNKIYKVNLGN